MQSGKGHIMFEKSKFDLEFNLLNNYQRDFPLVSKPFEKIANDLGVFGDSEISEEHLIDTFQSLQNRGLISRIGAVFRPHTVGVSALAALAVPPERMEEVAGFISALPEVNHNYQREHGFNLWFVVTSATPAKLEAIFNQIALQCLCGKLLVLPLLEQFHIDLGFSLVHGASHCIPADSATPAPTMQPIALNEQERKVVIQLQKGLPLVSRPFATLGCSEEYVLDLLKRWCNTSSHPTHLTHLTHASIIKRFGVVVRHHDLGYTANAMVVWDIPDTVVSQVGKRLAETGRVSLCYRRPRRLPHWQYNLFCMIHGKNRDDVKKEIATLIQSNGLGDYSCSVLFSSRRFKQNGANYVN